MPLIEPTGVNCWGHFGWILGFSAPAFFRAALNF